MSVVVCGMEEVVEKKRLRWAGSLYVGARDGALEYRLCVCESLGL